MSATTHTLDELREHLGVVTERTKTLNAEYEGRDFPAEAQSEWDALEAERVQTEQSIKHREAREATLVRIADKPEHVESERTYAPSVQIQSKTRIPADPTRIEQYRNLSNNIDDLEQAYRDGAQKVLETRFRPQHPDISREKAQDNVAHMLDTIDHERGDDGPRSLARRVIVTSSREYSNAFGEYLRTGVAPQELLRAASLTTTAGGFAVPVDLDPSVILVSSGVINPVRQLARVKQTTVNTVEFITSTGITAAYGAEATEASDNAPALAQPTLNVEKAFAFVPMSIEVAQDWAGIQGEMSMMFQDAKDTLENTKFLTGLGHGSLEPQGLIAVGGATSIVTSASTAILAAADLYTLENALAPRWRQRASIVGNRAAFQKVRQLDTAGGANLWVQLQNPNPPTLLGYNAYEWSSYASTITTSGSTVLTIGDFNQFAIVDRVGLSVELIPHLFGSVGRLPTGQRGLYMYWRNSSKVLTPGLGANSAFQSLKLL